ncbi:MAG: gamma-glutamyltransferase [Syntrophothermus sp.]
MSIFSKLLLALCLLSIILNAQSPDPVRGRNGMVVSASELASKVGLHILKQGGNAVDAAVAVGFALAVTYPAAGNIGGGGFMVIHTKDGKDITIDYREKAPLTAFKDMYLDKEGNVIPGMSENGVTSAGVPGSVAGLIYALEKYGTMKLADIIQPAINLATDGFPLDFRLAQSFNYTFQNTTYPSSYKVFTKNGAKWNEGDIFKQPDLGKTLKLIQEKGVDGFYKGTVAELIAKQVKKDGGFISLEDLAKYNVVERKPLKGSYRGYEIISMPPPSSGGVALIELLNILENKKFNKDEWNSSEYVQYLVEAMKYVYADRSEYLGDPDFYKVPVDELTSKNYAKNIFNRIKPNSVDSVYLLKEIPAYQYESKETTHYSVYDAEGNAVSTTTTINSGFGSKVVVEGAGFLLNNEMDDFVSKPGVPNQFGLLGNEANSIQPQKRMLSSMTPTIVLKNNKPYLIVGSPGGSTIITAVLQTIMNVIDFDMDIQEAIDAPRFHHQWFPNHITYERYSLSKDTRDVLESYGQKIGDITELGRVEGIMIDKDNNLIYGATDPRGNGSAEGY